MIGFVPDRSETPIDDLPVCDRTFDSDRLHLVNLLSNTPRGVRLVGSSTGTSLPVGASSLSSTLLMNLAGRWATRVGVIPTSWLPLYHGGSGKPAETRVFAGFPEIGLRYCYVSER